MKKEDKKLLYKWGAIAGAWALLIYLVQELSGIQYNVETKTIFFMIQILGLGFSIYMALRKHKDNNDNIISFGRCVFNSILISSICGILVSFGMWLYLMSNPSVTENYMKETERILVQQKHPESNNLVEYKTWKLDSIQKVQSTIIEKTQDREKADSTVKAIEEQIVRARGTWALSGLILTNTPTLILFGMLFSIFIAAVIANRKQTEF